MKITLEEPGFEILYPDVQNTVTQHTIMRTIEMAGRSCYDLSDQILDTSCYSFVRNIIDGGYESVIEHVTITVLLTTERGVANQLVRNGLAAFSQESARYIREKNIMPVIVPPGINSEQMKDSWLKAMERSAQSYTEMLELGCDAETARSVLPLCLSTKLIATYNLHMWRHVFRERVLNKYAHPMIRSTLRPVMLTLNSYLPIVFGDLIEQEKGGNGNGADISRTNGNSNSSSNSGRTTTVAQVV